MKKLEMLRPERKADSTTIDVAPLLDLANTATAPDYMGQETAGVSRVLSKCPYEPNPPIIATSDWGSGARKTTSTSSSSQGVDPAVFEVESAYDGENGIDIHLGRRGELTARVLAQPR